MIRKFKSALYEGLHRLKGFDVGSSTSVRDKILVKVENKVYEVSFKEITDDKVCDPLLSEVFDMMKN